MTGKNYNWHKRWRVDLSTCTATHESGLVVRFRKANDELGGWIGEPVNAQEWFQTIKGSMPPDDIAKHASRLMREAGDAYRYQRNRGK